MYKLYIKLNITYVICLSCNVSENFTSRLIRYLVKSFAKLLNHCCCSCEVFGSRDVINSIYLKLLQDRTSSSHSRRKFWHWKIIIRICFIVFIKCSQVKIGLKSLHLHKNVLFVCATVGKKSNMINNKGKQKYLMKTSYVRIFYQHKLHILI